MSFPNYLPSCSTATGTLATCCVWFSWVIARVLGKHWSYKVIKRGRMYMVRLSVIGGMGIGSFAYGRIRDAIMNSMTSHLFSTLSYMIRIPRNNEGFYKIEHTGMHNRWQQMAGCNYTHCITEYSSCCVHFHVLSTMKPLYTATTPCAKQEGGPCHAQYTVCADTFVIVQIIIVHHVTYCSR